MDTPSPIAIDLDALPPFACAVRVNGALIPLLSPDEAEDLDAFPAERGGLLPAVWRRLVGRRTPKGGWEALHLRRVVRAVLPAEHREIVDRLSTADLQRIAAAYMGAVRGYTERIQELAHARMRGAPAAAADLEDAPNPPVAGRREGYVVGVYRPFDREGRIAAARAEGRAG